MSVVMEKQLPNGWTSCLINEMLSNNGLFVDGDWVESKDQDENGDVRLTQLADIGDVLLQDAGISQSTAV